MVCAAQEQRRAVGVEVDVMEEVSALAVSLRPHDEKLVAGEARCVSSWGGISRNGHRLTRNGQTWTCTRCHQPAPEPDDYGHVVCESDEEDMHDMH